MMICTAIRTPTLQDERNESELVVNGSWKQVRMKGMVTFEKNSASD